MLATSNVCAWPCALLQPLRQFRRPAPCRLLKPVAAAAASATQQQGDVHSSSVMPVRDQDRLQLDVERKLGIPREIYDRAGGVRVRQHVNPLKKELQVPIDPPAWAGAYERPQQPLVLDVGCGYGRFLLALSKAMPGHNMLGLEIRGPIIERANRWAQELALERQVLFLRGNATITLAHTLASYPGPLDLACVQFPDPHFKARHKKRRTVQQQFVEELAGLMAPGARVFLQSDVLEAAEHMRDTFERHGGAWFQPCAQLHVAGGTFRAASEPKPLPQQQQQQQQAGTEPGQEAEAAEAWQSQWAEAGWLHENPLDVPTEREVLTEEQGLPVYRLMLRRV